ncbi:hypothetical protein [Oryzibacter oryziterrae]|uniref:hypothetical protein n=1 Tax=Oryzibacter oryziterrae TaxID=2766474 RepID=UPI001F43FE5F|nr:hypothetical protein [Oryzibacter oryziterrae]
MTRWLATFFLALAMALTPITASVAMTHDMAAQSAVATKAALSVLHHKASAPCHGKADKVGHDHATACCPVCTAWPSFALSYPERSTAGGSLLQSRPGLALSGLTVAPPDDPPRV